MVYTEFIQKLHVLDFSITWPIVILAILKQRKIFHLRFFWSELWSEWCLSKFDNQVGFWRHVISIIESSRDDHERSWIYNEQKPKLDYEKQNG